MTNNTNATSSSSSATKDTTKAVEFRASERGILISNGFEIRFGGTNVAVATKRVNGSLVATISKELGGLYAGGRTYVLQVASEKHSHGFPNLMSAIEQERLLTSGGFAVYEAPATYGEYSEAFCQAVDSVDACVEYVPSFILVASKPYSLQETLVKTWDGEKVRKAIVSTPLASEWKKVAQTAKDLSETLLAPWENIYRAIMEQAD